MNELEQHSEVEVVPYERGLSIREVLRGTLSRFLPASVLSMGAVGAAAGMAGPGLDWLVGVLGFAGALTGGFGLGMVALKRWLYPDADVAGRRSVVAGLLSPLAVFISVVLGSGLSHPAQVPVVLALIGGVMAVSMFFAWLSPTPEVMRGPQYGSDPSEGPWLPGGAS